MTNVAALPTSRVHKSISTSQNVSLQPKTLFIGLGVSHALVLCIMWALGGNPSPYISLAVQSFAGFAGISCLYFLHFRNAIGPNAFIVLGVAFLVRLFVSVWHYLVFIDPYYFGFSSNYPYLWEFAFMHESMAQVSILWHTYGFMTMPNEDFFILNKNAYLHIYNALLYYLNGQHVLNLVPWNILHTMYSASIVATLASQIGANRKQALFVIILVAFQPFDFLASIFRRDTVGQTWLLLSFYLIYATRNRPQWWLVLLPFSMFLSFWMRRVYALLIAFISVLIYFQKSGRSFVKTIVGFCVCAVFAYIIYKGINIEWLTQHHDFQEAIYSFYLLPVRLFRAVIGPFPWFQIVDKPASYEYMVPFFVQHIVNLSVYIITVPLFIRQWTEARAIEPIAAFGIMLFCVGIWSGSIHTTYISVGTVFFLPLACKASLRRWIRCFSFSFYFFLVANITYWFLGFYGEGITGQLVN